MLTAADPRTIGRYVVEDRLGRGGMGTVYLARDPQLGRQVAIKLIQAEFDSADGRNRFEKEARSIAALNHPNIVTVYDLGEFESRPFIVLEYIEGHSIDTVIREHRPIPMEVRLRWLEALGLGLQFAHDRGIIHRDIKPANLMIDHLGRLRILDFGIARIAGTSATQLSATIGTPGYMAPEYVLDQQVDQRVDVFAAGAVAYELLTYTPAFPGRTHATIIQKILECSPRRMSESSALVDAELEGVVMRALQRDPDARYQSAEAFGAALRELRLGRDWSALAPASATESNPPTDDDLAPGAPAPMWVVPTPTRIAPVATPDEPADTVIAHADREALAAERSEDPDVHARTVVVDRAEVSTSGATRGAVHERSSNGRRYAAAAAAMLLVAALAIGGAWLVSDSDVPPPATGNTPPVPLAGTGTPPVTNHSPKGPPIGPPAGGSALGVGRGTPPPNTAGGLAISANTGDVGPRQPGTAETGTRPGPGSASALFFQPRTAAKEDSGTGGSSPWLAGLRYQIHQLLADASELHVDADTVFQSGDRLRFAFETNADGYLYVVQEGSSGKWTVLFPNPIINGGRNNVTGFTQHVIPTDRGFRFEGPPGVEKIFVFFSKTPVVTLPGFDRPLTKVETIDRASVDTLEGQVRTRDLVIEEEPFTPGGNRDGTYVVNRDELATAVKVSFTLQHK